VKLPIVAWNFNVSVLKDPLLALLSNRFILQHTAAAREIKDMDIVTAEERRVGMAMDTRAWSEHE
jgi:hypothetical protein